MRQCEGILITGGCDPTKYDYYILDYAIKHRLPVLGICLGMQIMGTYRNQNELKPIGTNKHQKPKERYVHKVSLDPSSKLFTYFGNTREIEVNSRHVEQITTGGMFSVIGRSEDGIMEALENPTHSFQIGVQWHPESMIDYDENSRKLWKEFVKQCKKNKK